MRAALLPDPDPCVAMLEAENTALRDEIDDLRRAFLGSDLVLPVDWRLTATEAKIVALLLRRERVSKEQFYCALKYNEREIEIVVVESHVSKARRKLRLFDIQIKSARYLGYWIDSPVRRALLASMEARS
ncbi:MAG: winged helix-turn-helix domain-containing protein [Bradyrhizobium sp.]|nr:winged helix-turn-helix domain-containing protein [Bradyrhizobium sp.]